MDGASAMSLAPAFTDGRSATAALPWAVSNHSKAVFVAIDLAGDVVGRFATWGRSITGAANKRTG